MLGSPAASYSRDVKVKERVGLGVEADVDVGGAGLHAREALIVDANAHRLRWAQFGIEGISDCQRVEHGWSLLSPLVIENREGIGERGSGPKKELAFHFVELQLRGIERHHEDRHPGGEQLSR